MVPYKSLTGHILIIFLFTMIAGIFTMLLYFLMKKGLGNKASGKFFRLLWFILFTAYTGLLLTGDRFSHIDIIGKILSVPYIAPFAAGTITVAAALAGAFRAGFRDRKYKDPTVQSAVEAVHCAYILEDENGMVFRNESIGNLAAKITGKEESGLEEIWENIQNSDESNGIMNIVSGEKPVLVFPDRNVWTFLKGSFKIGERKYYELMGCNITEEYRLAEQIEQGRENLERQKRRVDSLEKGNEDIIKKRTVEGVRKRMDLLFNELNKTINSTRLHLSGLSKSDNETLRKRWSEISKGLR